MSELLPCPFCGGKPISYEYMGGHIIICRSCGINLTCSRGENFVKKWNTRHYPAEGEKAIERMKPKKVFLDTETSQKYVNGNFYEVPYFDCPSCGNSIYLNNVDDLPNFCPECGQALDWSEE